MSLFHGPAFVCYFFFFFFAESRIIFPFFSLVFVRLSFRLQLQTPFLMNQIVFGITFPTWKGRPLTKKTWRIHVNLFYFIPNSFFYANSLLAQHISQNITSSLKSMISFSAAFRAYGIFNCFGTHTSQPKCQQPTSCWLTRTCPLYIFFFQERERYNV
jgi:hypothetical protein